ncbi:MAG: DarT ssDNA thymidine ADP-ribosyltransferase family protein [Nautiliaceae bacterium]
MGKITELFVKEHLEKNGIKSLWHFTDLSNWESIKKYGIQSLFRIIKDDIKVSRFGANALSHDLDYYKGLDRYVHLSFTDDHPMYHIAKKEKRIINPIWIEIDINVLFDKKVLVCKGVANKTNSVLLNLAGVLNFDFDKMFHDDFEIRKEARKAEILIYDCIETKYIKGAYYGK